MYLSNVTPEDKKRERRWNQSNTRTQQKSRALSWSVPCRKTSKLHSKMKILCKPYFTHLSQQKLRETTPCFQNQNTSFLETRWAPLILCQHWEKHPFSAPLPRSGLLIRKKKENYLKSRVWHSRVFTIAAITD